jgi:hypothetical protein
MPNVRGEMFSVVDSDLLSFEALSSNTMPLLLKTLRFGNPTLSRFPIFSVSVLLNQVGD